jgi:catechol 2,3-dioxygenase
LRRETRPEDINAMAKGARPNLAHMGIFVHDIARMEKFYTETFGFVVTDHGVGNTFKNKLVFMSGDAQRHHQVVLAEGRPPEATFSTVMQMSFTVESLDALRALTSRAVANGATDVRPLDHGNAWSVYFKDPEGNTCEVYLDTPWYIAQPHGDPLDLGKSNEQIMRDTEATCRADPTFMPQEEFQRRVSEKLG